MQFIPHLSQEMSDILFDGYTPNLKSLLQYGFVENDDKSFTYTTLLDDDALQFEMTIDKGIVSMRIADTDFGEDYTRHLDKSENGAYVTSIRQQYHRIVSEIRDTCFVLDSFQSPDAVFIKAHLREKYGCEPEYLWKTPDAAAIRCPDTQKWFGCMMHVARKKVDLTSLSDENIEIINLHMKAADAEQILDFKSIFPGFHMHKKTWFSVILDSSVPHEQITEYIRMSYESVHKSGRK